MKKLILICAVFFIGCKSNKDLTAYDPEMGYEEPEITEETSLPYRASETKSFDLIHTKLDVSFDWSLRHLLGQATITMKPHFYPSKTIFLNARGMDINQVSTINKNDTIALDFSYENDTITINLKNEITRNDKITVFIKYISKPDELKDVGGSEFITSDKGLYFINADGKDLNKPKQIWTQGETQSNSVWFPTIDAPNQKSTEEINITIENNFKTLSNGTLIKSISLPNNMRTDCWRMDLPHAPYLFMMAIGEYAIVKDKWRNKEVNYYVEPKYEKDAKAIFGNTPEMMEFYSKLLGVDYAWPKYSQVIVRDYVSGAMENTSATIHGEFVQQTTREIIDNNYEDIVAHELFHHWFGDLVTCESWSNLPLNESFATYSEYLWNEYKYGRENADFGLEKDLNDYLSESESKQVNLIRFNYENREDMFDRHSYAKGGTILHMLRKYVGDEAFFASLKLYLERNSFKTAEVHDLRICFEEITGEDLNWFFNQWFLDSGHPSLSITYDWDEENHTQTVSIDQLQDIDLNLTYKLPVDIDFYFNDSIKRERIIITDRNQSFDFIFDKKPLFVNFDAEKMLTCVKSDYHGIEDYAFILNKGLLYKDKKEALESIIYYYEGLETLGEDSLKSDAKIDGEIKDAIIKILSSSNSNLINTILESKYLLALLNEKELEMYLSNIANNKKIKSSARSAAIYNLPKSTNIENIENLINDSSKLVVTAALGQLFFIDAEKANKLASSMENSNDPITKQIVVGTYSKLGNEQNLDFMLKYFEDSLQTGAELFEYCSELDENNLSTLSKISEFCFEKGMKTMNGDYKLMLIFTNYMACVKLYGKLNNENIPATDKLKIKICYNSIVDNCNKLIKSDLNKKNQKVYDEYIDKSYLNKID